MDFHEFSFQSSWIFLDFLGFSWIFMVFMVHIVKIVKISKTNDVYGQNIVSTYMILSKMIFTKITGFSRPFGEFPRTNHGFSRCTALAVSGSKWSFCVASYHTGSNWSVLCGELPHTTSKHQIIRPDIHVIKGDGGLVRAGYQPDEMITKETTERVRKKIYIYLYLSYFIYI